jgi:hypothetical protein
MVFHSFNIFFDNSVYFIKFACRLTKVGSINATFFSRKTLPVILGRQKNNEHTS